MTARGREVDGVGGTDGAGAPGRAAPPESLSVVVPSVNGWGYLRRCLSALESQTGGRPEVVVADRVGGSVRGGLREEFPWVRVVEAPPDATIPELRARAFRECSGDVVGVLEDHVIVPPGWSEEMLAAHRAGARVVGGSVENAAHDRLVDRAAFLCEYSHCLEPGPEGPAEGLVGNNVTYRRSLLVEFRDVIEEGRWEDRLHAALREAGVELTRRPAIRVDHEMHYTAAEYARQRYLYSRAFAALRLRDERPWRRLLYGLGALALPPVLLARVVGRTWRSDRPATLLLRCLPMLGLFVTAWAVGESIGALAGDGGALARVR